MEPKVFNRFALCFFDVLGFEAKFNELGLSCMLGKYEQLVGIVNGRNASTERVFGPMGFSEGAYWVSDGDAFIFSRLYGACASDSILVWMHADFPCNRYPEALGLTPEERSKRAADPAHGWAYHTVPCDNLMDLSNEIVCRGIEIGLPLRGALAMGEGVFNLDHGVFMGAPLIEAVRMESAQQFIGASCMESFMHQVVPERYTVPMRSHLKPEPVENYSGLVLDWPRHWRVTRKESLREAVNLLNTVPAASIYYENTMKLIDASEQMEESRGPSPGHLVRGTYPQFSSPDLVLPARAVRRVPIADLPDASK